MSQPELSSLLAPVQSVLADALVRLGCDHPYHSLYQLFALRNGNLGADGKPTKDNILMSHKTDLDKVRGFHKPVTCVAKLA